MKLWQWISLTTPLSHTHSHTIWGLLPLLLPTCVISVSVFSFVSWDLIIVPGIYSYYEDYIS